MKRAALMIVLSLVLLCLSAGAVLSVPVFQNDSAVSAGQDLMRAVTVFSQIFSAGLDAAGKQLYSGSMTGTAEPTEEPLSAPTEEPVLEPVSVPTEEPEKTDVPEPVLAEPGSLPESEIPEFSGPAEAQVFTPPSDPEQQAVSFGMTVNDFYNTFKSEVKNSGRHSVSFEEKGRKNASKVVIDSDINVFLYYSRENGSNVISRINFETEFSDSKQQQNAEKIFSVLLETLCGSYYGIANNEQTGSDLFALAGSNGSAYLGDLMIYGEAEEDELKVKIYYTGHDYQPEAVSSYSQNAENEFRSLVAELKRTGVIPESSGEFRRQENFEREWAQINWYQWYSFDFAKNFVISADIDWHSASNTPNYEYSGCGFVMRAEDENNNLYGALNMDGKVHLGGIVNGARVGYGNLSYGSHSTKGTAQLILVVSENTISAYVNGSIVGSHKNIALTDPGSLAFSVWSGTNKDYGTRCSFRNVYYYVWE